MGSIFSGQINKTQAFTSLLPIIAFIKPYKLMVVYALLALLVTAGVNLSIGQGVKFVIDNGFIAGSETQLKNAILVLVVLITLLAIGTFSRFYLMSWLGERVSADIRKAVFNQIIKLHPSYFEENRSGEIMSRLTTDTTLLQSIIGSSFSMALRSVLMLCGGLIMLFVTNLGLTLWVVACVPFILIPILIYGRKVRVLAASSQDAIADIGTYAGEIIQNIKVVQSYTHEDKEQSSFANEVENAFTVAKDRIKQRSLLIAIVIFLTFSAISIMLWIGGMDVLEGKMTAGELGAFVFYAIMVAMSVATISEVYGELQRAAGSATRLLELLEVTSKIRSPDTPKDIIKQHDNIIEFKNLDFYYPSRPNTAALKSINLKIPKGKVVALVGPSGAGKTTLFELLQRFYDPQMGHVLFNNININELELNDVRKRMGMVPQHPVLFSSDVWHNIRYGDPTASDDDVIKAAELAHANEFIEQLPEGYNSFLGEQGVRLSGGQKQRIALARAILKDPEVLLLDEATSALDAESEHHVQAALEKLMENRTTLIIAHRLSTVVNADLILLMDKGEIVAQGTHTQLIHESTLYKRLCELQFDKATNKA
ncbi:ABC transporter transmembrane domain-containing protein [Moritella viscosa]|uniref:ABC-type multidrug transport system, ATPase and permease component n=1 Tax=Moritella viscosa TaxID=80854 RepID=A0A090IGT3_9GAMM|nr:ABC transporter transmembrane domain-containing protein [Moritella viscosa]CED60187.1 ABC-type multidrug transport system, ATPase and permease component [Moritella viscosa]SGY98777.1 ABC-type multidrug transport system, ATPase and permease component [Moritella viscosa]SGZ05780.1 ABC-type multidrug transport system, ATPase and permease component [Moritella viscosa]SGZ13119.1 ABC-type multidrug transport system, ATPase and permease component [Moritella viscosa]SGZ13216.1 ABC-type multidrug tr